MNIAVFKSVNSVGDNSYFIRLKVDKNMYVHYDAEWEHEGQKMMDVKFKPGYFGAVCFVDGQADDFLRMLGEASKDVEKVKVISVVSSDGSLN